MLVSTPVVRRSLIAVVLAAALLSASGGVGAQVPIPPISTAMPARAFDRVPGEESDRAWLRASNPLGPGAPRWARRLYLDSLLVLRRFTDPATGAMIAGERTGWDHVWPRDAAAGAIALASSGHRDDAQRVLGFLAGLDLGAAARFSPSGEPVPGRPSAGDSEGWVLGGGGWEDHQDYGENETGDLLGNAIAAGAPAGEVIARFGSPRGLTREEGGTALDSAAAWAVLPFAQPGLTRLAERTLLQLTAEASPYGIAPTEDWTPGEAWTAPTAWSAWALASLGDDRAADRLLEDLRRAATPHGTLPERVSSADGRPLSTTPLAWAHAFAALALLERYPG